MTRRWHLVFVFFLGALIIACATQTPASGIAQQAGESQSCDLPACASLVISQDGQPGGPQAAPSLSRSQSMADLPWKIDTGSPSPDGNWVAYTSVGNETGGPVFLNNVPSGQWVNLIEQINAGLPEGALPLAYDHLWDVIGWLPDGSGLAIGPVDLSLVVLVDLNTFESRFIPFPGGGRGGRMFVDLAPDGSRLLFIGDDSAGDQVMAEMILATGEILDRLHQPYAQGVLSNPRYSPDQERIAYLVQTGQPDPGLEYAIHLLSTGSGETRLLADGDLAMTVPEWSPDGRAIAFVRRQGPPPSFTAKDSNLQEERGNVWVVSLADQQETQVTFADGLVRSPTWAANSQVLAYVTGDGQVQLVDLTQPGETWQASGPSLHPELTTVFFLP